MPEITLTADTGRATGTSSSNRLRGEGRIPAVLYGQGVDATSVSVDRRELRAALHTDAGHNALINLEVGGSRHLTIVKSLQRHPVRNDVVHVDFIVVDRNEAITVDVPITLVGEAHEVEIAQGTLDQVLYSLTLQAKPGSIPNEIVVDVSALTIGDSIRVGDLSLPAGVSTEIDPDEAVVMAALTRAAMAETEEGDEASSDEGAESAAEGSGES
ncbi:MAG TPA: 50S ribosomal protein L25 [Acidimicrobiales bacterium]|jgi:large subunit ribosomal protein L25